MVREHELTLGDGRTVAFVDYGPAGATGVRVFNELGHFSVVAGAIPAAAELARH